MKAISIRPPWGWLICRGFKPVENRDWSTDYRGPILIHSSKTLAQGAWDFINDHLTDEERREINAIHPDWPRGAIIGEGVLVDCVSMHLSPWFVGPYGFVIREAKLFEWPIPYRGQLGIFDVPDEVVEAARKGAQE